MPTPIILASSSPRRRLLLRQIGLSFEIKPAGFDEIVDPELHPAETVESLALQKAELIARRHPDALVIGSDTVVVHREEILGKPSGPAEACEMLRSLSGATHQVYTGVALILTGKAENRPDHNGSKSSPPETLIRHSFHERTDVTFGELLDDEIDAYVRTGSPLDKAGAYGIQDDLGALFVEKISGDYYNVVGFPLFRFYREVNKHVPGVVTPFELKSNPENTTSRT